jgi:hypothetical protein
MAFPSFDTATNLWAPQANISWVIGNERKSEFVRFAKRVFTEAEAATSALNAGQSWVDNQLKKAEVETFHGSADDLGRSHRQAVGMLRPAKTLTFDQFKRWVDRSAFDANEQQLQKSYAALLQLRKRQHCSWAELIAKVRNSRPQILSSNARRGGRGSKIPLTLSDWRRII